MSTAKRSEVSVLVVDNDSDILKSMPRLFHKLPVRLRCAANAIEALAQIEADPPDLLITDLAVPTVDGLMLEEIRVRWPEIKVVLHTVDGRIPASATALGISAVLTVDAIDVFPALVSEILAAKTVNKG